MTKEDLKEDKIRASIEQKVARTELLKAVTKLAGAGAIALTALGSGYTSLGASEEAEKADRAAQVALVAAAAQKAASDAADRHHEDVTETVNELIDEVRTLRFELELMKARGGSGPTEAAAAVEGPPPPSVKKLSKAKPKPKRAAVAAALKQLSEQAYAKPQQQITLKDMPFEEAAEE
jgi:hypothetical protein